MSKLISVDADGRYCCEDKVLRIGPSKACGYTIHLMNTGPLDLLVHPTGETDEPSMVHSVLAEGSTNVIQAGTYKLDFSALCEALENVVAPEDPAAWVQIGCDEIPCENLDAILICQCIEAAFGDLAVEIDPASIEALKECLTSDEGSAIEKLCAAVKVLTEIKTSNEAWCLADGVWQQLMLDCMAILKTNTAAITGMETSLAQVGCTETAEGVITGHVLICKKSDTTTDPVTNDYVKVWFGLDGTVVDPFTGPYRACTNLNELLDCLTTIKDCPKPFALQCVRKPTRCVGYDNGRTPGSSTNDAGAADGFVSKNWAMTVKGWMVNGTEVGAGAQLGPFGAGGAGWTAQLQAWADFMNANMPTAKCTAAFGFLPAPTWRYTKITCHDLHTQFGPLRLERDDTGACYTIYPLFDEISWETRYKYDTLDCDGNKATVWCDAEGNTVEAPVDPECWYDCTEDASSMIGGPAGPECGFPRVTKACDDNNEFYIMTVTCEGEEVTQYFTAESWEEGNPEAYEPSGVIKDCITGEPITGKKSLFDALVTKPDTFLGANYSAAFCYINGRPNSGVPWAWIDNTDPLDQDTIASGNSLPEFIANVEALGYTEFSIGERHYICPVPANFNGAGSHFFTANGETASKPAATALALIPNAPAKVLQDAVRCALQTIGCNDDRRDGFLEMLVAKACFCPATVTYDAVCNPEEQTVNGVTIPALAPIIRQISQPMQMIDGVCTPVGETTSRFFDFLDPTTEFTDEVAFEAACDPQTTLCQERCDAKGRRLKVVTITVDATGSSMVSAFYDAGGNLIVPALPLTVCDPVVIITCGCIRNKDGSIAIRGVDRHSLIDALGTAESKYYVNGALITPAEGQTFDCDCEEKCPDTIGGAKYTYPMGAVTFPCTESTLVVDGEETDLCGEDAGPSVIPSTGDICANGGIRSDFDGDRCYVDSQSDPADYASELLNFGTIGNKTNNPLATQATANFCMAVKGTFPSLEGTTSPTISLDATWHTGSGIALAAFDCVSGQDLNIVGGTVSTYDAVGGAGCQVPSTRGPNDAWGGVNNGLSQTTVFDTSGVADLGNVVFYSIVLNPTTQATNQDWLDGIAVNGLSPQGSPCDIQTIGDLVNTLSALLPDCDVALVGESLCITCESTVLGDFTCDATTVTPAITDLSRPIMPSLVALSPKSIAELAGDDSAITALLDEQNELIAENLVNNTLTMDCICNPICPAPLTAPLDKEAGTLELEGNVVVNYTAGQAIALMNANGEICGEATVANVETPAVFSEATVDKPNGFTTIQIVECELQEGKTPAVIDSAKPVAAPVKQAIKSVVKQVSIRQVKLASKTKVKTETKKTETVATETRG